MIRVLSMIAIAGFLLSVVCLSIAIAMAGPDVIARGAWSWNGHGWHVRAGDGPSTERQLAWSGEALAVEIPADVRFVQADGPPKLMIRGPKDVVDHVTLDNGRIGLDRSFSDAEDVTIELTAPRVTRFDLDGSGRLDLSGYNQDSLEVRIAGDGEVSAKGSAKSVRLQIDGSGDADLSGLAAEGADVRVAGSGDAKVAAKSWAKVDISGSGDVNLLGRPARLESHVSGSGQVIQDDASPTPSDEDPASPDKPAKPEKPARPANAV